MSRRLLRRQALGLCSRLGGGAQAQVKAVLLEAPHGVRALARELFRDARLARRDADVERVREVVHGADGDLVQVLVEARLAALHAQVEEALERGAHVHDVVLVALHREAFHRGLGERRECVDDVLDREEGREVELPELLERARGVGFGVRERLRRKCGVERALVDRVADGAHDALSAHSVVVVRLVVAAPQVQDLERTRDGDGSPVRVAEVRVADAQALKSGEAEQRGETQFASEDGVVGDVIIAFDDRNEGASTDEVGGMECRAGDTVEREVAKVGDRRSDGHDEPLAPVHRYAAGQWTPSNQK